MKKNGFTLVEILSVIAIIGMFLLIVFPAVSKAIITAQIKYFESQENAILFSGRDYFSEDRSRLPKAEGAKKAVSLATLVDEGYIKMIVDNKSRDCNPDQTYVEATYMAKGDYQYYVRLVCIDYDTETAMGEWSDWTTIQPTGTNIDVEIQTLYNYQEPVTYYSDWTDWTDVVVDSNNVIPIAEIIGTEEDYRTLYRYQDQQWKWYKLDNEYSGCVTSSPGTGWTYYSSSTCTPTTRTSSSCSSSAPGTGWSIAYRCADPTGPSSVCQTTAPAPYPGGTWSQGAVCDTVISYYCANSNYILHYNPLECFWEGTVWSDYTCTATCIDGWWGFDCTCSGNCNAPCPAGDKVEGYMYYDDCPTGSCTTGSTLTCTRKWNATCIDIVAPLSTTIYYYTYTWYPTPTYIWETSVSTAIYSRQINVYYDIYSSVAPDGYPNKDTNLTQFTVWTDWDITSPTTYDYRTIEDKDQVRTRSIIMDWSGDVLPDYVPEADIVVTIGKPLNEIKVDPNINLKTIVVYRYRTKTI